MPSFKNADSQIIPLAKEIIEAHYKDLATVGVRIEYLFAYAPEDEGGEPKGQALKLHGYPVAGICKINSLIDRVRGLADARIILDGDRWPDLDAAQRNALLDHELHHILVSRNMEGEVIYDSCERPKLKMKLHDFNAGWFMDIAARHGESSPEVTQARHMVETMGQQFFPFVKGLAGKVKHKPEALPEE